MGMLVQVPTVPPSLQLLPPSSSASSSWRTVASSPRPTATIDPRAFLDLVQTRLSIPSFLPDPPIGAVLDDQRQIKRARRAVASAGDAEGWAQACDFCLLNGEDGKETGAAVVISPATWDQPQSAVAFRYRRRSGVDGAEGELVLQAVAATSAELGEYLEIHQQLQADLSPTDRKPGDPPSRSRTLQDVEPLYHSLLSIHTSVHTFRRVLAEAPFKLPFTRSETIPLHSPRVTFPRFLRLGAWTSTDSLKQRHLVEDVVVASWLISFWESEGLLSPGQRGFVELGCGNGLLTHILLSAGYNGHAVDISAHSAWHLYPPSTTVNLRAQVLNPPELILSPSALAALIPPHSFIIANHADELTPWVPLLAAASGADGFLMIPCCRYALSGQAFKVDDLVQPLARPSTSPPSPPLPERLRATSSLTEPFYPTPPSTPTSSLSLRSRSLNLNDIYQLYLAQLAQACGWVPERETLRLPIERNFGVVASRTSDLRAAEVAEQVGNLVAGVPEWVPRKEGSVGGHP